MAKIKMKTKSSVKKRFKVTGKGKLKRSKANTSHLLSHKSTKRKRQLRKAGLVDSGSHNRIKECLPYA